MPSGVYFRTKEMRDKMLGNKNGLGHKYIVTEETREKLRKANLGKRHSENSKEKLSKTFRSKIELGWKPIIAGWWKNKKHTKEHNDKISEAHIGMKHSEESKEKMSKSSKGQISWNKGRIGTRNGAILSKETKAKMSKAQKALFKDPEYLKKILHRRIPTSLEKKFQEVVDKNNLPYRYVGNGNFFIERFNPDFINTNNEKIAIEVYARYYKLKDNRNIGDWKEKRNKVFNKYGWKIIYFDETEVEEQNILNKLKRKEV